MAIRCVCVCVCVSEVVCVCVTDDGKRIKESGAVRDVTNIKLKILQINVCRRNV